MEPSLYLEAIQKIPGTTPGEKYKALNLIAQSVIAAESTEKDGTPSEAKRRKVPQQETEPPEILKPLVDLEVAKQLRRPDVVAEALKSEDRVVFHRALKVKWFFDGSCINVDYFRDNIMPYISMHRRCAVLKVLAKNLAKNPQLAEVFYTAVAEMYGEKQAQPLLMACGEAFILDMVNKFNKLHKYNKKSLWMRLTTKQLTQLTQRYPSFLQRYIAQCNWLNDKQVQLLLRRHASDFMKHITAPGRGWYMKISGKGTKALIRSEADLKPVFTRMSKSTLAKRLLKSQLESLIQEEIFPPKEQLTEISQSYGWSLYEVLSFLQHYSDEEKVAFIYRSFEKLYPKNIFRQFHRLVTPEMFLKLPLKLQTNYARKQLQSCGNNFNIPFYEKIEYLWICYLPTAESIHQIQACIDQVPPKSRDRRLLYEALILTCHINSDKEALLNVLEYLATYHKDAKESTIVPALKRLQSSFDLPALTLQYWKYIDVFNAKFPDRLVVSKIHCNLIHGLPIDSLIDVYAKKTSYNGPWNIFETELPYERQCLEKFVEKILALRENNPQYWETHRLFLAHGLAAALLKFNGRNFKAKTDIPMMSIKDYPVLKSAVKEILITNPLLLKDNLLIFNYEFERNIKSFAPDLYRECFPVEQDLPRRRYSSEDSPKERGMTEALRVLKNNPQKVVENWEKYFKSTENIRSSARNHFFRTSLWYQDLPMKFADKCLQDIAAGEKCGKLAAPSLFEGTLIEKTALADPTAISQNPFWSILTCTSSYPLVNPQPSLNTFLIYYQNNQIKAALFLTRIAEYMPVNKAQECALKLLKSPNKFIIKQGIKIIKKITPSLEAAEILFTLMKNPQQKWIRLVVYMYVKEMLIEYNSQPWWLLWNKCVDMITLDDRKIIKDLHLHSGIPEQFMLPYIKKLFAIYNHLDNIKKPGENILDDENFTENKIDSLLSSLTFFGQGMKKLPEEYHNEILKTFFGKMDRSANLWKTMERYILDYIVRDRPDGMEKEIVESRLKFVTSMALPILKNYWNVPHPQDPTFYPANSILTLFENIFTTRHLFTATTARLIRETLKSLTSVLSPLDMPSCYMFLTLLPMIEMNVYNAEEMKQTLIPRLSSLVEIYSEDSIKLITEMCYVMYPPNKNQLNNFIEVLLTLNNSASKKFAVAFLGMFRQYSNKMIKKELYEKLMKSDDRYIRTQINFNLHNFRMRHDHDW